MVVAGQTPILGHYQITGIVIDSDGKPLAGAQVTAAPDLLTGKSPNTVSDGEGKFALDVYKTGRWTITVSKQADGYISTYNPYFYPDRSARPEVVIPEIGGTQNTTVRLPGRTRISQLDHSERRDR